MVETELMWLRKVVEDKNKKIHNLEDSVSKILGLMRYPRLVKFV